MTPEQVRDLVRPKIEGMIPDLCDGLETNPERRDALQDFAGDWIYDRYADGVHWSIAKKAAKLIAEHYFGKEEDDEEEDPTPWCHTCGAMYQPDCFCGNYADNH